ncbi:MAG: M50 family metallopeptidase [Microgenomates group bacterium]
MSILIFVIVLSFLVIIHELGHFFAARWAGIKVEEFGIGYPPRAMKLFTWKGTVFSLNWIPFGGFVRMSGEDVTPAEQPTVDETETKKTNSKTKNSKLIDFYQATTFQKMVVILAGATVNFLFGAIVFAFIFTSNGIPQPITSARIGYVSPDSPAATAGIPEQVEIIAITIDEQLTPISTAQEVIDLVEVNLGKTVTLTTTGKCDGLSCQESAATYEVYARTNDEQPENQGAMGIAFDQVALIHYPAWEMPFRSIAFGFSQAIELSSLILVTLGQLGTDVVQNGTVPTELAGPVGIAKQAHDTGLLTQGLATIVSFAALLSVNLAIMNVLPIPPLDGGRAVLILLGLVLKKKHIDRIEYYSNYTGYIFLMGLIILVTARDIFQLFV